VEIFLFLPSFVLFLLLSQNKTKQHNSNQTIHTAIKEQNKQNKTTKLDTHSNKKTNKQKQTNMTLKSNTINNK